MPQIVMTASFTFYLLLATVVCQNDTCYKRIDILLIMDDSDSVGQADFQKELQFAAVLINLFEYGLAQFSVMRLDSYPSVVVDFDDFNSSTDLKNAILRIRYNGGSRDTAAALKRAREKSFSYCHGARDGVTKIVILSTDGQSKNPNDTAIEAQKLKSINDVLVISIGLGSSYDKVELETIATYPEVVFEVVDYVKFVSVVYNYTETICRMNN